MAQETFTARVNKNGRQPFDAFCGSIGLNAPASISLYIKAVLPERRIPFEISHTTDPLCSGRNQVYVLKSAQKRRNAGSTPYKLIEVPDK